MTVRAAKVIQAAACAHFGLDADELLGRRRYGPLVNARHLAMYLCRERLRMSFPALGEVFGRDHSTILEACNSVRVRLPVEPELRTQLETLERSLDEVGPKESPMKKAHPKETP